MKAGDVVRALAGKDRGKLFLVLHVSDGYALIADGRRRKVCVPKRKSQKHLSLLFSLSLPHSLTNQNVKKLLQSLNSTTQGGKLSVQVGYDRAGGCCSGSDAQCQL